MKHGLRPVFARDSTVLILGSLPGDESLARQQYYGHPQNQFWRLLDEVADLPLMTQDYAARLATLQRAGIALWDVVAHAERKGSLDSALRHPVGNDLMPLIGQLPVLRLVAFNGAVAAKFGERLLSDMPRLAQIRLPSSSAAYTRPFAEKLALWHAIRPHLRAAV
ncbi:MAG: DNA-deoxyinosine glycosylase [Sphingopyxis sp.]|nr:DNA-deoxyinosine glycosylase [Sphingopyxis sp.]